MHLAIINSETHIVENCVVPPEGAQIYFVGEGYYAIETDIGAIGDTFVDGDFISPDQGDQEETE